MSIFGIGDIIVSFNKLLKRVESYCESQRKEVERLSKVLEVAKSDQVKGEAIAKALKNISSGE